MAPVLTSFSAHEIFCLHQKGIRHGQSVMGTSVHALGIVGEIGNTLQSTFGSELAPVTHILADSRKLSHSRMQEKAKAEGAAGLARVRSEIRVFQGNVEFLSSATCVQTGDGGRNAGPGMFSTSCNGQEVYCLLDAGYAPLRYVFSNAAYRSSGSPGAGMGTLKGIGRGELKAFSERLAQTRQAVLQRLVVEARGAGANAVVGIETRIFPFQGVYEMVMTGTAARNPALPESSNQEPVTCDLTAEELWNMTQMGYMPVRLVMGTAVYPLGAGGGLKSILKTFTAREMGMLTALVQEARERVVALVQREAEAVGAETVAGLRTHLREVGELLEFTAVGTAIKRTSGLATSTPFLPPQAVIRERETWSHVEGFTVPELEVENEPEQPSGGRGGRGGH